MNQSVDQMQTVQTLHGLSMAIGSSLDLDEMVERSLQAYLTELDCAAGAIFQRQRDTDGHYSYEAVLEVTDQNITYQVAVAQLAVAMDETQLLQFLKSLPFTGQTVGGNYYYLLEVPDFGLMILVKNGAMIDPDLVKSLEPLQRKLGMAAQACLSKTALKEAQAKNEAFQGSIAVPMFISRTSDGQILFANQSLADLIGQPLDELIGTVTPNYYYNAGDEQMLLDLLREKGSLANYELLLKRADGTPFWSLISIQPLKYLGEDALITTLMENNERKEAQVALAKRAAELELVAEVSTAVSTGQDANQVLQAFVDQTKQKFGFYHAHVYLINEEDETLILTSGAGEVGQQMVKEGRTISLGQKQSIVAQAARSSEGVTENDAEENPTFLSDPLLPETRSEAAIPLLMGDKVIGVLAVQSDEVGRFTDQDVAILTILAAQTAITLQNVRQYEEAQTALADTEAILNITKMASRSLDLEKILAQVLDQVLATTNFEAGLISMINPATNSLEILSHHLPEEFLQILLANGLDGTLCDLVYRRQEPVVVVDLAKDSPIDVSGVIALGFHAYQGVPLEAKGEILGTLCIFSNENLASEKADTSLLLAIGRQLGVTIQNAALFEQTQTVLSEIQRREMQLADTMDIARMANWEFDFQRMMFIGNDRYFNLLRRTVEDVGGYEIPVERYLQEFVHPDDAARIQAEIEATKDIADPEFSGHTEYRMLGGDGSVQFVELHYRIELAEDGKVTLVHGSHIDVTERKVAETAVQEAQARASIILEAVTLPLLVSKVADGTVLYANDQIAALIGISKEDAIGKQTPDFYRYPEAREEILRNIRERGGNDNQEIELVTADGRPLWAILSNRLVQFGDEMAIITTLIDITGRKEAETALAKRAAELEAVSRVSAFASSIRETDKLLQAVVDLTKERFDLYHSHIYLLNPRTNMLVLTAGAGEVGQEMVTLGRRIPLAQEQSLVAQAARTGQGVTENDVRENPTFLPHPLLPDTRSEMAVPMIAGRQLIGVLDVQSDETERFTEEDVVIQTTLAAQVAVALENARSFEQAQEAIESLNQITRRLTREGWQDFVADLTSTDVGYIYDPAQLEPILPIAGDKKAPPSKAMSNGGDPDVLKQFTQSLTIHGEQIGKLALLADEEAAEIDAETAEIVSAIAEQLSARIDNLRLTDQTQSALAETEILYAASAALNAAQTYEDVFEVVQKHTKLGQKADFLNLGYFNRPWTEHDMPQWIDILAQSSSPRRAAPTILDLTAFPHIQLLRPNELLIIENVDDDPRLDERSRETIKANQNIISAVFAPLVAGGLWIGYVSLFFTNPPTIVPEDGRRLMLLAGQAAVAVQSIRLLDMTRKQAQREQLLRQVTDRVRSSADVDTIMKTAVQEIGRVLGRRTYIYLDDKSLAATEDAKD